MRKLWVLQIFLIVVLTFAMMASADVTTRPAHAEQDMVMVAKTDVLTTTDTFVAETAQDVEQSMVLVAETEFTAEDNFVVQAEYTPASTGVMAQTTMMTDSKVSFVMYAADVGFTHQDQFGSMVKQAICMEVIGKVLKTEKIVGMDEAEFTQDSATGPPFQFQVVSYTYIHIHDSEADKSGQSGHCFLL